MKQKVQLITIAIVENDVLKIEIMHELANEENVNLYFVDDNNKKYEGESLKSNNCVKMLFYIPIQEGKLDLQLENKEKVTWLDNKNENIIEEPNEYKIFTKKQVIAIVPNGTIEIKKRKTGDKLRYELLKQYLSIRNNKKLCLLRILKTKEVNYLFNDRILYGDDNAEQLFKYINHRDKKMAQKCYFVLDAKSPNYKEIKKIGKVLKFGSLKHKIKYLNAKMILSSHASYYDRVYNPFSQSEMEFYKDIICKKFVFLQHGIVMNDVHKVLQRSHTIADLFVTTTNEEYQNVQSPLYMYEKNVVICTGLPRFDKLVDERKKIILISPTWRAYLTDVDYTDDKNNKFETSEFFTKYSSLLKNKELLGYLKETGYEIKFLLHPAFQEHKEQFDCLNSEKVKIILTKDIKYCNLFNECSILITDYSSIHFDVAFLKKPIIYYQFDKEKFFKSHYTRGYYNYETEGFGKVIQNEQELIEKVEYYINNNCKIEEEYIKRIQETFRYLDRENSARVYEEILKLENKKEKVYRFNKVS